MINVSKPYLPPFEEYCRLLKGIWDRNHLTNNGPCACKLEESLKEYLGIPNLLFVNNGTTALQLAIKTLELKGEIITTPFSYVATTSSIVWEGAEPVFVDIDPYSLNMDPSLIEKAVTKKTTGILATHVFGNPCDVKKIHQIAIKYDLKVIYDGAHAFGTALDNRSIFEYGDISATSFHATKLFHTIEGGAVMCNDADLFMNLASRRNFGQITPEEIHYAGINGKNSEFHAAMGLLNLEYIDKILNERKRSSIYYDQRLEGLNVRRIEILPGTRYNYSYYPIIFDDESALLRSVEALNIHGIYPRRYFKPSLNELVYVKKQAAPVSEDTSHRILCLPLYYRIRDEDIDMICKVLWEALTGSGGHEKYRKMTPFTTGNKVTSIQ
jgi:dTDP-4-amino-4,6-dideoxygalactose transaminase